MNNIFTFNFIIPKGIWFASKRCLFVNFIFHMLTSVLVVGGCVSYAFGPYYKSRECVICFWFILKGMYHAFVRLPHFHSVM